jgi:para-aminobenzoate synthetase
MKLLLVDNYDSFTFNLYQLAADVFGAPPVVVKNDDPWELIANERFDAAIISPGPGTPEREADFGISRRVLTEMNIPVLGVCLGHQGICHLEGAPIVHAPQPMHGRLSEIFHDGGGLFKGIPNPFTVVRYHSLVAPEPLPSSLRKTAWTEDGLVMGVTHQSRPVWGVQFHPESICTTYGALLMENFRRMAEEAGMTRKSSPARAKTAVHRSVKTTKAPENVPAARQKAFVRRIELKASTVQIFERVFNDDPYAFWLDSSLVREPDACFSFMGSYAADDIECIRYNAQSRTVDIQQGPVHQLICDDLFAYLKKRLASVEVSGPPLPFDFNGGLVGYFGYELKAICGGDSAHTSPHPDAYLIQANRFLAVDHLANEIYLVYLGDADAGNSASEWFRSVQGKMAAIPLSSAKTYRTDEKIDFTASQNESDYLANIGHCLEAIKDGESYEVCLTNRLTAETSISPFEYYKRLRARNPAPYASFFKFPELSIASSSPERFLKASPDRVVESKPIKGTIRRGADELEDKLFARWLAQDEKSQAENLMIVDLLRNDLGRVCTVGTVTVPKLMQIETYATVHQLVSTITGRLEPDRTVVDCLQAAFPGGSMTGAPKIRTMEIIDQLEGQARGVYSGSIGFLAFNGTADLNIVIRTAVFSDSQVTIGVGGAIIALSDPQEEWNEILLKAKAPLATFEQVTQSTALSLGCEKEVYGRTTQVSKRVG